MKSSQMLEAFDAVARSGEPLPAGVLRLCAERGSARVKERLYRAIVGHEVVVSALDAEFRMRFVLAQIIATFELNDLLTFDHGVHVLFAELDNYGIGGEMRTALIQELLTFIDTRIGDDAVRRDMETIVIERLVTERREIADRKRFAYSDRLWHTIVSANDALGLPRIG